MNKIKETNEMKLRRFEEVCRRYLYEKQMMKEIEKRYVNLNYGSVHYNDHLLHTDALKRYRILENHVRHVDDVFSLIEKQYGTQTMHKMKEKMIHAYCMEQQDTKQSYSTAILKVLNQDNTLYRTRVR